jgi:hypothetical protein
MEVSLLIFLLEYCAQGIGRGVCVYHEGFGEVWLAKYRGGSDSFLEGIKRVLSFVSPVPLDVFMGQLIEGSCDATKVPDPVVIE